jgi:hypothetical protein
LRGILSRKGYQKYKAKPVWSVDENGKPYYIRSTKQAIRWSELLWLRQSGVITELKHEPEFEFWVNKRLVATWRIDATYVEKGQKVAEEVKGKELSDFKIKRELFIALYSPEWEYRQI